MSKEAQRRPRMCVSCGKLAGVADECPWCGASQKGAGASLRRIASSSGEGGGLTVTGAVITTNLFLYATALVVGGVETGGGGFGVLRPSIEVLFRMGLQDNAAIAAGDWWRLVLMMFLHLGALHVAFNCYILWYAGRLLEADLGGRLMFFAYMASGLGGSIASYAGGIGGGGASGAVFGTLGAILVRRWYQAGRSTRDPVVQHLLVLVGINLIIGFGLGGMINNHAHLGGLFVGAGIGWVLSTVRLGRGGAVLVLILSTVMFVMTLAAFGAMALSLSRGSGSDVQEAQRCWRKVHATGLEAWSPESVQEADRCLRAVHDLEPEAERARDMALEAFAAGNKAWDEGDAVRVEGARARVAQSLGIFATWFEGALPRYGLSLTPR